MSYIACGSGGITLTEIVWLCCCHHRSSHWPTAVLSLLQSCTVRSTSSSHNHYHWYDALPLESVKFFQAFVLIFIQGSMNGLYFAGGALGSLFIAWTAAAFGRLRTIQFSCAVCILGAALMTGAANIGMFLASRFIMGWGVGMMVCAGK